MPPQPVFGTSFLGPQDKKLARTLYAHHLGPIASSSFVCVHPDRVRNPCLHSPLCRAKWEWKQWQWKRERACPEAGDRRGWITLDAASEGLQIYSAKAP